MNPIRLTSCQAPNSDYVLRAAGAYVAARTGLAVEFHTERDWPQRYEDLEAGRLDLGWICGAPWVRLHARAAPLELLAAPVWKGARYGDRPVYYSDVIVRRASAWQSFDDLRAARFAFNERGSLSGYECVRGELARRGERGPFFVAVIEAGSHQNALALIAAGEVDAAAIDTTVLEEEQRRRPELEQELRSIHTLGPAPMPPIVMARSLPGAVKDALRNALLEMHLTPEGKAVLETLPVARFDAVDDAEYEPVRALLARAEQVRL